MNSTFSQLYLVTKPVYKAVLSNIYDKGQMDELNELNKETMLPTIDEKNNDNVENNTRSDNDNSTENTTEPIFTASSDKMNTLDTKSPTEKTTLPTDQSDKIAITPEVNSKPQNSAKIEENSPTADRKKPMKAKRYQCDICLKKFTSKYIYESIY